jgi:hypothetical protein
MKHSENVFSVTLIPQNQAPKILQQANNLSIFQRRRYRLKQRSSCVLILRLLRRLQDSLHHSRAHPLLKATVAGLK